MKKLHKKVASIFCFHCKIEDFKIKHSTGIYVGEIIPSNSYLSNCFKFEEIVIIFFFIITNKDVFNFYKRNYGNETTIFLLIRSFFRNNKLKVQELQTLPDFLNSFD